MTVEYTDYDPITRDVVQSGFCPNENCLPPVPEGAERLLGVVGMPERDTVTEDGQIVRKP